MNSTRRATSVEERRIVGANGEDEVEAIDDRERRRHPRLQALLWVAVVALAVWPFPVW